MLWMCVIWEKVISKVIAVSWKNWSHKEQVSLKKEVWNAIRRANVQVLFDEASVMIGNDIYTEQKLVRGKLKDNKGGEKRKKESFAEKIPQSKIASQFDKDDYGWLKYNTDTRKTASIYILKEHDWDQSLQDNERFCGEIWMFMQPEKNSSTFTDRVQNNC